jgi:hypothetical protein
MKIDPIPNRRMGFCFREGGDMRKKHGIIFAVIGIIIFFFCMDGWGADWKYFGSNDFGDAFYDSKSITRPSRNIVRVWRYMSFTEKGEKYYVEKFGKTIENMSYSIDLGEINCKDKVMSLVSVTLYSKEGKVVGVEDHAKSPVFPIVPTSIDDLLYKEVCK